MQLGDKAEPFVSLGQLAGVLSGQKRQSRLSLDAAFTRRLPGSG
jgi:hypothetical protein